MTDAPKLKPCPFCGSDELSYGWSAPGYDGSPSTGNVECHNCNALIYTQHGERDAIAAWNTRAPTVDDHEPASTAVDDSAAVNTVVNDDLVEAVARALCVAANCDPDETFWGSPMWVDWQDEAQAALTTATPLIRARIADWLVEQPPHLSLQEYADMIREGEV